MSEPFSSNQARRAIVLGLLISGLLISIPALLAYRSGQQLSASFRWVAHTMQVDREIQRVLSSITDAETSQRGYLLRSDGSLVEAYRQAAGRIPEQLATLQNLTADNAVQQRNLRALAPLLAAKLEFMAASIALEEKGEHEAALARVRTGRGQQAMEAVRAQLERMAQTESELLSGRERELASRTRFSAGFLFALVGLNLLFAAVVFVVFRRLARVQSLVTVCAWSRTVEYEGEWLSFEQYLLRRFNLNSSHGISPAEAEKALREMQHH